MYFLCEIKGMFQCHYMCEDDECIKLEEVLQWDNILNNQKRVKSFCHVKKGFHL